MSLRRAALGIGSTAADKLVVTLVQLLLVPVLANAWGLTLFGIWAMMVTIPTFLVLADFGIVTAAWARMTSFIARDERDTAKQTLHTAFAVSSFLCLLFAAGSMALIWLLPGALFPDVTDFSEDDARLTLALLVLYGLGTIMFRLVTAIFRANGRLPLALWCNTGSYGGENLAMVGAVMLGAGPAVAAAVLLTLRLVAIGMTIVLAYRLDRHLRPGFASATSAELRELWRPALSATMLGLSVLVFLQGSTVVLGLVAGAAAVPAFVAVRTVSRLGVQMSLIIANPIAQDFAEAMARGQHRMAGRYFSFVAVCAMLFAVMMGAGLVFAGQFAIRLWTDGAIVPSLALLALMAVSSAASILWNPICSLVLSLGRQRVIANAGFAASLIGLLLIWLIAGDVGTVAAGAAFAFVDSATLAAALIFVSRNWLRNPDFKAGLASGIADLRNPRRFWRNLRRHTSGA